MSHKISDLYHWFVQGRVIGPVCTHGSTISSRSEVNREIWTVRHHAFYRVLAITTWMRQCFAKIGERYLKDVRYQLGKATRL